MGKRSPKPPPAPDYMGAAQQQAQANIEAARTTARLSNPNISTPLGGQRVRFEGDTPFIEQYLTPDAQATLDAQQRVERALAGLGEQGIGRARDVFGREFRPTGLPEQQFALDGYGEVPTAPDIMGMGEYRGEFGDVGDVTRQLDLSGLAALPVGAGTTGQQAIMSRLEPQMERERASLENRLRNQGLVPGSEGYNREMELFNQRANDLTQQAALQGINLDAAMRAQGFGERQAQAGLANLAQQQAFGQQADRLGLFNTALGLRQQAALQQAQAGAGLQGQRFNQAQAAAAFRNAQREAALREQLAMRQLPLNEIAALMSGAQVQMPQFQAYQGADVAAAPIFGATQAAGQFAQQNYQNQIARQNAQMGLYGALAGMAGTALGGPFGGALGQRLFQRPPAG